MVWLKKMAGRGTFTLLHNVVLKNAFSIKCRTWLIFDMREKNALRITFSTFHLLILIFSNILFVTTCHTANL